MEGQLPVKLYTTHSILVPKINYCIPARDPKQCVCVCARSISRKSSDLALASRELMVAIKVGIVVTVAVVVGE